jgi:hypothetical protein
MTYYRSDERECFEGDGLLELRESSKRLSRIGIENRQANLLQNRVAEVKILSLQTLISHLSNILDTM